MPKPGQFLILLITIAVFFLAGASHALEVAGVITDSETGAPLAQAGVIILNTDLVTLTNADGFYYFPDVPPGAYTFMIGRDNYQTTIVTSIGIGWICGDANSDTDINILDVIYLINFKYKGGPAPSTMASGDVNSDSYINILDIVYLINFKYKGGPAPFCP